MSWMPNFTSIDLTRLDLTRLPDQIGGIRTEKVVGVLRDSSYVMIGFGVLKFQQLQVRRRDLEAIAHKIELRLPDPAGVVLDQAHGIAKAAGKQVRGLIRNAA